MRLGIINAKQDTEARERAEQLAQSYARMTENKLAWSHLLETIAEARDSALATEVYSKSVGDIKPYTAHYVKAAHDVVNRILSRIESARRTNGSE